MTKTTLIMFSGGIDSTYLLKKTLTETDDIVLAHHIHLMNGERRDQAEAEACKNIKAYCQREFREFFYSESTINRRDMAAYGFDAMTCAFEAGVAAINFGQMYGHFPDEVMLGYCWEDTQAEHITEERKNYQRLVMEAGQHPYPDGPPAYVWQDPVPKQEMIHYLGTDLLDMCWSCRTPRVSQGQFRACGNCFACEFMKTMELP